MCAEQPSNTRTMAVCKIALKLRMQDGIDKGFKGAPGRQKYILERIKFSTVIVSCWKGLNYKKINIMKRMKKLENI